MNKKIIIFQILSAILISILGTLLHFTFNWSGDNFLVGAFSAVNESTWEHLKLLFFPMLITTIIGYFYIGKTVSNFLCSKTLGTLTAILFTVIFFYTSGGIIGENIAILNIATFFIAVILGEYVAYRIMLSNIKCNTSFSILCFTVLFISFVLFTFHTPEIGLFEDPVNKSYGIYPKNEI